MKPIKEVKTTAKLKLVGNTWELFLTKRSEIISNCLKLFADQDATEFEVEVKFTNKAEKKSPQKFGYFYGEIIPRITQGLLDAGYWDITEDDSYSFLCKKFLGQKETVIQGEVVSKIVSLSDVGDTEMRLFMDKCIKFGQNELNLRFQTPEEYKLWKTQQNNI